MISTHSLPADTRGRVRRSIEPLCSVSADLARRSRVAGATTDSFSRPWRWMVIVYSFDPETDVVAVATIQTTHVDGCDGVEWLAAAAT